jgi:hypothetical protein
MFIFCLPYLIVIFWESPWRDLPCDARQQTIEVAGGRPYLREWELMRPDVARLLRQA